jgi:hypothetical protein
MDSSPLCGRGSLFQCSTPGHLAVFNLLLFLSNAVMSDLDISHFILQTPLVCGIGVCPRGGPLGPRSCWLPRGPAPEEKEVPTEGPSPPHSGP